MAVNLLLFQVGNRVALICSHTDITLPGFSGHNPKLMNDTAAGAKPGQGRISRDSEPQATGTAGSAQHLTQDNAAPAAEAVAAGAGTVLATTPLLLGLPCSHLQYPSQEAFN